MAETSALLSSLWTSIERFPSARWPSALSQGQLGSKDWLIEKANRVFAGQSFDTAFVIGGWYGLLPALWKTHAECPVHKFRSIDSDESCAEIAETINKRWVIADWQFKATTADAYFIDYNHPELHYRKSSGEIITLHEKPELIINTCCEHLINMSEWLNKVPEGIPLILQSNNLKTDPQHVNCHNSLIEFQNSVNLKDVLYAGELKLENYTRFMVIGYK